MGDKERQRDSKEREMVEWVYRLLKKKDREEEE